MCAKWVSKLWILNEKVRIFDKTKWVKSEWANQSEQNQSEQNQREWNQRKRNQSEQNQNFLKSPWAPWSYFCCVWVLGDLNLTLMLFDLKIYIREFLDSWPGNPRAPSFLGFSDVLSDETAIRFTLSDIQNCRFLRFSGVNRTASLNDVLWSKITYTSKGKIWKFSICSILVVFGFCIHFWAVVDAQSIKRMNFWFCRFLWPKKNQTI